jgi:hypothetical protein
MNDIYTLREKLMFAVFDNIISIETLVFFMNEYHKQLLIQITKN